MSDTPPAALGVFWHALYYARDPRRYTAMTDEERKQLTRQYTPEKILAMYDAVQWAIAHPTFGFVAEYKKHLPPEPPLLGDDAAILEYFRRVEEGMRPVIQQLRPT